MKANGGQIRAAGFSKLKGDDLIALAGAVFTKMPVCKAYPRPPIDYSVVKEQTDNYIAALGAALDGGKKARQTRDESRLALVRTLLALSHYAELKCNNDQTTFLLSGFPLAKRRRMRPNLYLLHRSTESMRGRSADKCAP